MAATAAYIQTGAAEPMERTAFGKLIEKCPGGDLETLDKPPGEPGEDGEPTTPGEPAGVWVIEMPTDTEIVQAMLEEMSADSMRTMIKEQGSLDSRGMRSEVMGKLAMLLLPNEEWCAEKREVVRRAAISQAKAEAVAHYRAVKAADAAHLAHTRAELAWFPPAKVVHAMVTYTDERDIQENGCVALGSLVLDAQHRARVVAAGGVEAVVAAMVAHPERESLQERGCCALAHFSADDDARACAAIAQAGGLEAVAGAMRTFGSVAALQQWACAVLAHTLAAEELDGGESDDVRSALELAEAIVEAEGVGLLLSALKTLPKDATVQRECCAALAALARHEDAQRHLILSRGAISGALSGMRKHMDRADMLAEACLLLATLAGGDADAKRAVVDAEGVGTVCQALAEHEADGWLQAQGLTVLWVLLSDPPAIDHATGLVNGVNADYRETIDLAGAGEIAESARNRFSGQANEDDEDDASNLSGDLKHIAALQMEASLDSTAGLSILRRYESDDADKHKNVEMHLIIEEWKDEQGILNQLLAKAKALDHPGIDDEGISTMQEYIDSGRFPRSHYIGMWEKRLVGMGVAIKRVPKGEEQASMLGVSVAAVAIDAPVPETSEEEEEEDEEVLDAPERDDAVVMAAEGVLRKLHEGEPEPTRPWTQAVPMTQAATDALKLVNGQLEPDPTIFLWHDPDLMAHSASRNLSQLTQVGALDEEAAGLREKLENMGEEPLTRRRREMDQETFQAAEEEAAGAIRGRLSEIAARKSELPPEEEVAEILEKELPAADPERRPRSPPPSRRWKPAPVPPSPPTPPSAEEEEEAAAAGEEEGVEGEEEGVEPRAQTASEAGWGGSDRAQTADTGTFAGFASSELAATGQDISAIPEFGGDAPSFYNADGEVMPALDQTKQRWKAELELEDLLASQEYAQMRNGLQPPDSTWFKS